MATQGDYVFRPLRRTDYASYLSVVRLAIGDFETSTGLDVSSEATIAQLSRRSVWFILHLLRLVGRPIVDVLVAVRGREVVGTATALWLPRAAYLAGVATKPELRGRGIASRLLGLHAERARRHRRAWMALDVESGNRTAIRVYESSGFRDVGRFSWFTRADPPPASSPPSEAVVPVGASDWAGLAARIEVHRAAEYRGAFPAGEATLTHNELMVRGGRVESRTWKQELPGGGVAALRAYFIPGVGMAAYFPISSAPEASPDAFVGLIDTATDWLRPRFPSRFLAVTSEPRGNAAVALERRGFTCVASTTAMIARVGP